MIIDGPYEDRRLEIKSVSVMRAPISLIEYRSKGESRCEMEEKLRTLTSSRVLKSEIHFLSDDTRLLAPLGSLRTKKL